MTTHTPPVPPAPSPEPVPDLPGQRIVGLIEHAAAWMQHRPWLAAVPIALLAAAVTARGWWQQRAHTRLARHAHYLTITPPAEVDPAGAAGWWANLAELLAPSPTRRALHGVPHVAVEYRWTGRQLTIGLWLPGTVPTVPVAAAARAAWPGAAVTTTDPTPPIPADAVAVGGALGLALPGWYPLSVDHDADPLRPLLSAAAGLHDTEHACVQVLARPATPRQTTRLRRGAAALRTGTPTAGPLDAAWWVRGLLGLLTPGPSTRSTGHPARVANPVGDRDAGPALDKATVPLWEVSIRYAAANVNPRGVPQENLRARLVTLAHGLASAYGGFAGRNRLQRRRMHHPARVLAARTMRRGFLLSAAELAAVGGLPTDVAVPGLDRARAKAVPAPVAVPAGGRATKPLGRAELGGHAIALPVADARQHLHVMGSTGCGKTTCLCHLILADIRAGRGVAVIDPKGDLAADLLDRLTPQLVDRLGDDLVVIDPDQPAGATLNPLAGDDPDLVVDNIVSIFSKIFQRHWGPRIDDVLRVACLTLMRRTDATLTLVPPLLTDKQFRAAFTVDLDDPEGLRGFWEWYETTPPPLRAQVIGPVLARLRAFLLRDFVRRTLGTPRSSFDMGRILDRGLLIARLPKGQIGEETAKLMGSFVFASVWQAATARARHPETARRDATVYIDEAHNVLNLAGSVTGLVDRFRPLRPGGGSYPWHYVLDQTGAELVAASRGQPPPRPSHTADRKRRIATSPQLAHQLGVNQFFTDLAGWTRTHPPAQLERWWSDQRCATPGAFKVGLVSPVRPDAHGILTHGTRRIAFFLEHDTGTEPLPVLTAKLARYTTHATAGGPTWPVLLWLPTTTREHHLHQHLNTVRLGVPVATAARDHFPPHTGPADTIWLVHGRSDPPRRLLDLTDLGDPPPPTQPTSHTA